MRMYDTDVKVHINDYEAARDLPLTGSGRGPQGPLRCGLWVTMEVTMESTKVITELRRLLQLPLQGLFFHVGVEARIDPPLLQ